MNAEPPVALSRMEHHQRRPGYAKRYPTKDRVDALNADLDSMDRLVL